MVILGFYAGHDSSVAILKDGIVLDHLEAERRTRVKHYPGFPDAELREALKRNSLAWKDVDFIVVAGTAHSFLDLESSPEWIRILTARLDKLRPGSLFGKGYSGEAPDDHVLRSSAEVDGVVIPVLAVEHHVSHAAEAYFTGPYDDAVVFTSDGGGDGAFTLACRGKGNLLSCVDTNSGRNAAFSRPSVGALWSQMLHILEHRGIYLGGDHEGKLMGLAAYGKPREGFQNTLVSMMRDFESLWRYDAGNPVWTSLMGNLHASLEFRDLVSAECHDFVASLQGATEQFTQELIDGYMKKLGLPEGLPVCLGGGVAYNCCSNHAMLRRYGRVHVPCSPYDGGLPVGAVLFVWHHILGNTFSGVSEWSPYRGRGVGHADESVASQVVQDLLAGKVVSWYSGRSENGKRALGNRSILADPRIPWMRENLNQRVKLREWYRPFAPSVLSGYAEWADGEVPASPYMSFSCKVSREWATRIPAVVHVDRTCRPQIVTEKANPVYYRVIDLFRQATGIPMVLNTSFNRQEPIVDTPEDALKTFLASGVQVLYINGHRYTQEGR